MSETTYCSHASCIVANMGRQILHTSCTNIDSTVDHNVMSFNVAGEYGRNVKLPQLLTEVIQGVCNFGLPRNFLIRNLLSKSLINNRVTVISRRRPLQITPYGFNTGIWMMIRVQTKLRGKWHYRLSTLGSD